MPPAQSSAPRCRPPCLAPGSAPGLSPASATIERRFSRGAMGLWDALSQAGPDGPPTVAQLSSNAHNLTATIGGNAERTGGTSMAHEPGAHEPTHHQHQPEGHGREPDEHAIRERAYAIWVEEGKPEGRGVDHW